ncbi:MAG: hypothetical protein IIZ78_03545 [Clostridiales bacterium]|nr:hypothetical protein [Clostridiales bacterium]
MTFTFGQIAAFIVGLLGLILTVLNIIDRRNNMKQAAEKPFNDLKKRVDGHDIEINDIKQALKLGNDRFREQEATNATFKSVMLSFVNFEIAYCLHTNYPHTEELIQAKDELESYLTGHKHERKNRD